MIKFTRKTMNGGNSPGLPAQNEANRKIYVDIFGESFTDSHRKFANGYAYCHIDPSSSKTYETEPTSSGYVKSEDGS